jgi:hypothetical protein
MKYLLDEPMYNVLQLVVKVLFKHNEEQQQQLLDYLSGRTKTMPIIQFGERDLARGKVVEPAWYVVNIDAVTEGPSKDGGSTNYPVEGTIVKNADSGSEEFKGVPLDWNFNSKAIGFAVGFLSSFGVDVKAGQRFDLANAVGRQVEVFVENGEWQGRIVNRVNHKYRAVRA